MLRATAAFFAFASLIAPAMAQQGQDRTGIDNLVTRYAKEHGVPESLVHRIIVRESRYNPRAIGRGGAMGLMQIKHATARGAGYVGPASGLLDAETNLRYAVKYLAGAWQLANGSQDRAVRLYASGYYYEAKRRGLAPMRQRDDTRVAAVAEQSEPAAAGVPAEASALAGESLEVTVDSVLRGMDR